VQQYKIYKAQASTNEISK